MTASAPIGFRYRMGPYTSNNMCKQILDIWRCFHIICMEDGRMLKSEYNIKRQRYPLLKYRFSYLYFTFNQSFTSVVANFMLPTCDLIITLSEWCIDLSL